jgi:hypothetical protein
MPSERFRKHLRISLRTVMALVLVVAIVLGWRVNKAREQRRIVAAVNEYGGWVHYDWEFTGGKLTTGRLPWAPSWLRSVFGDEFFQEVVYVCLIYDSSGGKRQENNNSNPCDLLLAQLASQTRLKELLMMSTQATDKGLEHVGKMAALEALSIWRPTSITDSGVAHLAGLKSLKRVRIDSSPITDTSLILLSGLPHIEELSLQDNHFTDEGFLALRGQNTLRQLVTGRGDFRVTDAGLAHLKEFKKLRLIDLRNSQVTARGLESLKAVPSLRELWLSGISISYSDVATLRQAMPGVKVNENTGL